jgi:hypothetical protein
VPSPDSPRAPKPVPPSSYQAYLLRLWRDGAGAPWRASLEPPGGEPTLRFGTVATLFAFLRDQLADPAPAPGPGGRLCRFRRSSPPVASAGRSRSRPPRCGAPPASPERPRLPVSGPASPGERPRRRSRTDGRRVPEELL